MSRAVFAAAFPAARPDHRDAGSVSMFTVVFAFFVIVLAGLLVDGGLAIHARQRAADVAEQAARAAADDIDVAHLRTTGEARINRATACGRAFRLLRAYPEVSARECAVPADNRATVRVTIEVKLQLLSIVPGFDTFTMDSEATAEPQPGI